MQLPGFLRLPWKRTVTPPAVAPPTPYDRWMRLANFVCLGLAVVLLLVSFGPAVFDAAAANDGADINITTEFYTAFDGGGGYVTWDFSARAASELRARIDAAGNHDGSVDNAEFLAYTQGVDDAFTRQVLVYRSFEIAAVQVIESRGIQLVSLNASAPAHLKIIMNGQWAARDADVRYGRDKALEVAYGNLSGWETVRERTLIIAGGGSTFTPLFDQARVLRVPGGSIVVEAHTYANSSLGGGGVAAVHIARFSPADSTWILLIPLAIGYFLGLRAPRREQESSGHKRIAPLHNMLAGGFVLLLSAYFAGVLGIVIWAGGIAFGAVGLWLSFQLYPAERVAGRGAPLLEPPAPKMDPAAAMDASSKEKAMKLLPTAVGPLEHPLEAAKSMLAKAHTPLELPDEETPRPGGRFKPPVAPSSRPPPPPPSPRPAPAAPAPPPKSSVRCPGCKHRFDAEGHRPLAVTCPHCGRRGVLR